MEKKSAATTELELVAEVDPITRNCNNEYQPTSKKVNQYQRDSYYDCM